jgi:hypothetical protein
MDERSGDVTSGAIFLVIMYLSWVIGYFNGLPQNGQ